MRRPRAAARIPQARIPQARICQARICQARLRQERKRAAKARRNFSTLGDTTSAALDHYAKCIGLAFQVMDDVLDAEAPTATLGKTAGKDAADNKPTYVSLLGVTRARELALELRSDAHKALAPLGASAERLRQLADFVVERTF